MRFVLVGCTVRKQLYYYAPETAKISLFIKLFIINPMGTTCTRIQKETLSANTMQTTYSHQESKAFTVVNLCLANHSREKLHWTPVTLRSQWPKRMDGLTDGWRDELLPNRRVSLGHSWLQTDGYIHQAESPHLFELGIFLGGLKIQLQQWSEKKHKHFWK